MTDKIKRRWYVINATDDNPSWNPKTDSYEMFWSRTAAIKKAKVLADENPHVGFHVCGTTDVAFVDCYPVKHVVVAK